MRLTRGKMKAHSWLNELPNDLLVVIAETLLADAQHGIVASVCLRLAQKRFARLFAQRLTSTDKYLDAAFRASYRWTIDRFDSITDEKTVSGLFRTPFGHEFRLLLFPRGNMTDSHASVYLEVGNHDALPDGWVRRARVTFRAVRVDEKEIVERSTPCELCDAVVDWGFREFLLLESIRDFLRDGTLEIDIHVSVTNPFIQRNLSFLLIKQRSMAAIYEKKKKAIRLVVPRATRDVRRAILTEGQQVACLQCQQPLTTFMSAAAINTRGSSQYVTCARSCIPVHVLDVHERLRCTHGIACHGLSWPLSSSCVAPEWLADAAIDKSRRNAEAVLAPYSEIRRERHSQLIMAA